MSDKVKEIAETVTETKRKKIKIKKAKKADIASYVEQSKKDDIELHHDRGGHCDTFEQIRSNLDKDKRSLSLDIRRIVTDEKTGDTAYRIDIAE